MLRHLLISFNAAQINEEIFRTRYTREMLNFFKLLAMFTELAFENSYNFTPSFSLPAILDRLHVFREEIKGHAQKSFPYT